MSDTLLTWASALGAITNGLSRFTFGVLTDKIGFRKVFLIFMSF